MGSVASQQRNGQSNTQNNKSINQQYQYYQQNRDQKHQQNNQNEQKNHQLNLLLTQEDSTDMELCAAIRPNNPPKVIHGPYTVPTQQERQTAKTPAPKRNVTRKQAQAVEQINPNLQPLQVPIQAPGPSQTPATITQPIVNTTPMQMDTELPIVAQKPKKTRKKTKSPPIKYDIVTDVLQRKADITVGDLMTASPVLRRKLSVACRPKRIPVSETTTGSTMALIEDEDIHTTAVYATVNIGDKMVRALIDCGAAKTCISKALADALGLSIDSASTNIFTLGNTTKQAALGMIYDVPITVKDDLTIPCNAEVLPACPTHLIIGNNWLHRAKARIDFNTSTMKVNYKNKMAELDISFVRKSVSLPKMSVTVQSYKPPVSATNSKQDKHVHFEDQTIEISDDEIEINNYTVKLVVKKLLTYHIRSTTEPQISWFADALGIPDVSSAVEKLNDSGLTDSIERLVETFGTAIEDPTSNVESIMGTVKGAFSGTSSKLQNNVLIIMGVIALIVSLRDNRKTLMSVSAALIAYAFRGDISRAMTSLNIMEKIKSLFISKNVEDETVEMVEPQGFLSDSSQEMASLISMPLIGSDAFKNDAKSAVNLLKDFGSAKSSIQSLISMVLKLVEFIIHKTGTQNQLDKLYFFLNDGKVKYDEFAQKVFELDDLVQTKKLPNTLTSYEKVTDLLKNGQNLLKDIPRHASTPGLINTLSNCINRLQKYSQAIASSGLLSQGLRQEPVCVLLRGGPGTFKSQTAQHLATALISLVIDDNERESFSKNPSAYYYNRTIEQQYWDGYDSNKIVTLFDDAFQQRDCVGGGDSEAMNIIRAINENSYDLHMANLNDKGSTKFRSSFVILTTNAAQPDSQQILDRKALLRRFHCSYTVVPKEQYEHAESGRSTMDKKIDINKLPLGDLDVSTTDPSVSLKFIEHDMLTNKPTGRVLTFREVVEEAHKRYLRHLKYYEQKIKELDDRRDEYFHLRDEVKPQMAGFFSSRPNKDEDASEFYEDAQSRLVHTDAVDSANSYIFTLCNQDSELAAYVKSNYQCMSLPDKISFYFRIDKIIKAFGTKYIVMKEKKIAEALFGTYYDGINTILNDRISDDFCIETLLRDAEFSQRWIDESPIKYYFGNKKSVVESISDSFKAIKENLLRRKEYVSFVTWKQALALTTGLAAIIGISAYFFFDKKGDETLQTEGDYKMKPKKKIPKRRKASEIRNMHYAAECLQNVTKFGDKMVTFHVTIPSIQRHDGDKMVT